MKGVLLLNGEPYSGKIDCKDTYVVCCDGAYEWAHGRVKIDENVGDFDSLAYIPDPAPSEIYPAEKDFTDGEIALYRLIKVGVDEIEIYGGGGGREDHFLGNLQLLYRAHAEGVSAKMITNCAEIYPISGKTRFKNLKGRTLSVLPFGGVVHIMNSAGLKYSYPETLSYGECRGISNVVTDDDAFLEIGEKDCVLIIINGGVV